MTKIKSKKKKKEKIKPILEFKGKNGFLSNFWAIPIEFEGETYSTVEHAYQAAKVRDPETRMFIRRQITPGDAKRFLRKNNIPIRADWDIIKLEIMYELVLQKFRDNKYLREWLIATNGAYIEEGNTWGDTFWGVNLKTRKGENHLGKILMHVREQISEMED